jgi:hypothetical protein
VVVVVVVGQSGLSPIQTLTLRLPAKTLNVVIIQKPLLNRNIMGSSFLETKFLNKFLWAI